VQEVEGDVDEIGQSRRAPVLDAVLEQREVRFAAVIECDDLTIDDRAAGVDPVWPS
jgi:hypothetical protein